MNRWGWIGASCLVLFVACARNGGESGLRIRLVQEETLTPYFERWVPKPSRTLDPSVIGNINCFGVHVTGPGIFNPRLLDFCSTSDDFGGRGPGILSRPAALGQEVRMGVPAGLQRTFSVYGIYPSSHIVECGGSTPNALGYARGYALGGAVTQDITNNTELTVNVTLPGGSRAKLGCDYLPTGDASLLADGMRGGRGFYLRNNVTGDCAITQSGATFPGDPAAAFNGFADKHFFTPTQYLEQEQVDGTLLENRCDDTSGFGVMLMGYSFDLKHYPLPEYPIPLKIKVTGKAGYSNTTCALLSLLTPGTNRLEIFKFTASRACPAGWEFIGALGGTTGLLDADLCDSPLHYVDTDKKMYIRAIGGNLGSPSPQCSVVDIDAIEVVLIR